MDLTRRHLCDDWVSQRELRKEGKSTPKFNRAVKEREQKVSLNPNAYDCFGDPYLQCNTRDCSYFELCMDIHGEADGVVAMLWENDE